MTPRRAVPRLETIQTMDPAALERFLDDFSLEEARQARELWQTHAARKSLIDFEITDGKAIRISL